MTTASTLTPAELTAKMWQLLQEEIRPARHGRAIETLITQGADANAPHNGLTPLLACLGWTYDEETEVADRQEMHRVLSALLRHGADLAARTPSGESAADLATRWQDNKLASIKLGREAYRRSDPVLMARIRTIPHYWPKPGTAETYGLRRTFHNACTSGNAEEVFYYLHHFPKAGTWVDVHSDLDPSEQSGLTAAARQGGRSAAVVREILAYENNINWQDKHGNTALMYLVINSDRAAHDLIGDMIRAGADETLVNAQGHSPLSISRLPIYQNAARKLDDAIGLREGVRLSEKALQARLSADPRHRKLRL